VSQSCSDAGDQRALSSLVCVAPGLFFIRAGLFLPEGAGDEGRDALQAPWGGLPPERRKAVHVQYSDQACFLVNEICLNFLG